MSKELLNSSGESRNPWSSFSAYISFGSLGKVISLAEKTGLLLRETKEIQQNEAKEKAKRVSPSLKLITILKELTNLGKALHKVEMLLHHHNLEQEYKDVTGTQILEEKTREMDELSLHFSSVVDIKDKLISRLQQQFVGEYMNIDAEYHRYVTESVTSLSSVLTNLTSHLDSITWSGNFSLEDGKMEKISSKVASALAQMQIFHQYLCEARNLMGKHIDTAA